MTQKSNCFFCGRGIYINIYGNFDDEFCKIPHHCREHKDDFLPIKHSNPHFEFEVPARKIEKELNVIAGFN